MVLLAAMTPSWESASRPKTAPNPQNRITASTINGTSSADEPVIGIEASVKSTTSPRMSRLASPMMTVLTAVWATSHSVRLSGVVANFSKRLSSRCRAISLPTRDSGVNSTTVAR